MARSGSYTLDQMRNNRENMKRVEGVMGSYTLDKQPCFFCVQRGRAPWISLGQQWKGAEKNYVTREVFIKALDDAEAKQEKAVIRRNNDKLLKTINKMHLFGAAFAAGAKSGSCERYEIDGEILYGSSVRGTNASVLAVRLSTRDIVTAVWGPARKSQLTPDVFCGISMNPGMRIWSCYLSSNDVGNPIFQGVYEYVLDMLRTAQHSLIKAKGNKEIFKYAIEHVAAYYAQAKKLFKPGTGPETVRVLKEIEDRITAWDDVEQVKEINNAMIIGLRLQGKWQTSI